LSFPAVLQTSTSTGVTHEREIEHGNGNESEFEGHIRLTWNRVEHVRVRSDRSKVLVLCPDLLDRVLVDLIGVVLDEGEIVKALEPA